MLIFLTIDNINILRRYIFMKKVLLIICALCFAGSAFAALDRDYFDYTQSAEFQSIPTDPNGALGTKQVQGTNIDYPVMQNGDFYLHMNIYKNYSSHGTPYLAEYCNLKSSDNLIIYGHHMNDNTMFSQLEKYKNYSFYQNHKYIKFYTIENGITTENIYEIMIAFKTIAYSDAGFRYYSYTNFQNVEDYEEFVDNCRNLEFYNTGVAGTNNDKYITLSTCEYSQKNGRMVVVAKKV